MILQMWGMSIFGHSSESAYMWSWTIFKNLETTFPNAVPKEVNLKMFPTFHPASIQFFSAWKGKDSLVCDQIYAHMPKKKRKKRTNAKVFSFLKKTKVFAFGSLKNCNKGKKQIASHYKCFVLHTLVRSPLKDSGRTMWSLCRETRLPSISFLLDDILFSTLARHGRH